MSKWLAFIKLTRFDKPIGILLLLWPTLWALWIAAEGMPPTHILVVFVCGVVLMRAGGCAINDYADREVDGQVERTKDRPLVTGDLSPKTALITFAIFALVAFALVLTLNAFTIYLSFAGAALAAIYPFMKRFTSLPQIVLGAAFAWSIPMAFAAVTDAIPQVAWLLFIATVLWTLAYDTMYAMVDREFDLKAGIKSTAILFGDADVPILATLHAFVAMSLVMVGLQLQLNMYYYLALAVSWILAAYQIKLIKDRDPQKCFQAFLSNNWYGMCIFIGFAAAYMIETAPPPAS